MSNVEIEKSVEIMQGDAGGLPVMLMINGNPVTEGDISEVEITVGYTTKRYSTGAVTYDATAQAWVYPYTQGETLAMRYSAEVQARVRFKDDSTVAGGVSEGIRIIESKGKDVM